MASTETDIDRRFKVVAVEDEWLYLDLLKVALSGYPNIEIVGAFHDGEECIRCFPDLDPDVALLDIELSGSMNGIEVGLRLRESNPQVGIVLLSNHRDPSFVSSLRDGKVYGWSYLLKKSVSNVDALRRAIAGTVDGYVVIDQGLVADALPLPNSRLAELTDRQREILELIAQGYSNLGIAERLNVSVKTVENHINNLYQELAIERDADYHPRVMAVLEYLDQIHFQP